MNPSLSFQACRNRRARAHGFSLVEVTIAIAVVAIALLPILAMLPAGLTNYKNSISRTKATHLLSEIATCLQLATQNGTTYTGLAPFNSTGFNLTYTQGATLKQYGPYYFDENGNPLANSATPQLVAMVTVTPPGTNFTAGSAYIYVAWPAQGTAPTWGTGNAVTYPNAQGHEEITIPINPSSP